MIETSSKSDSGILREVPPGDNASGTLHAFGFPKTTVSVRIDRHDPGDRLKRGLMALAACWGLAAVAILVPIAHFVLVPGFFLLGIFLLVKRLGQAATIAAVRGPCPQCGVTGNFHAGGRLKPHTKVSCPSCHNELDLSIDEP